MALDESKDQLEALESNGITAYIDPRLKEQLDQMGDIYVDYQDHGIGARGFSIRVGQDGDCSAKGCEGCG
jgi:Fe-S cluster assembly iron-binding protein IscA